MKFLKSLATCVILKDRSREESQEIRRRRTRPRSAKEGSSYDREGARWVFQRYRLQCKGAPIRPAVCKSRVKSPKRRKRQRIKIGGCRGRRDRRIARDRISRPILRNKLPHTFLRNTQYRDGVTSKEIGNSDITKLHKVVVKR